MIKPVNAASIWIDDDMIHLDLPTPNGGSSHQLILNNDPLGWDAVKGLLKTRHNESRLGERGDPTQWHVDQLTKFKECPVQYDESRVKRTKPTFAPGIMDGAKAVLQKMGIIS